MPLYEYQCKKCEHKFEQLQKVTDKPLRICPQCKKGKLEKLISNTNFQLKGTGWYITDFRDKNKTKQDKAGDTKPAAKSEDKAQKNAAVTAKKETAKSTATTSKNTTATHTRHHQT